MPLSILQTGSEAHVFVLSVRMSVRKCVRTCDGACVPWLRQSPTDRFAVDFSLLLPARRYASAGTSHGPVSVRHKSVF